MARPLRIEFPDAIYHVMVRGNAGNSIFLDSNDYNSFLTRLKKAVYDFHLTCYAYCLMPNHYHLFISTPDSNLSNAMQWLGTSYTVWFNRRHERIGHLFQGRYKALIIEDDDYFWAVSRYIHLNPFKAGLVLNIEDWPWSSFHGYCRKNKEVEFVNYKRILKMIGGRASQARRAYKQYVIMGTRMELPEPSKNAWNGFILGNKPFIERIINMTNEIKSHAERELPMIKKMRRPYKIEDIKIAVAKVAKIDIKDLSKPRYKAFMHARKAAIYLCRNLTSSSARTIATSFGLVSESNIARYCREFDEKGSFVKRVIQELRS